MAGCFLKECLKIFIIFDFIGVTCAYTDIRFCKYRISACFVKEIARGFNS